MEIHHCKWLCGLINQKQIIQIETMYLCLGVWMMQPVNRYKVLDELVSLYTVILLIFLHSALL